LPKPGFSEETGSHAVVEVAFIGIHKDDFSKAIVPPSKKPPPGTSLGPNRNLCHRLPTKTPPKPKSAKPLVSILGQDVYEEDDISSQAQASDENKKAFFEQELKAHKEEISRLQSALDNLNNSKK
jgi:hypothetical protein